jgi:hypothetical protein
MAPHLVPEDVHGPSNPRFPTSLDVEFGLMFKVSIVSIKGMV